MIKGLYTAASGMMAQQVATDNMADNLANISTAGFKKRNAIFGAFPEMLLQKVQDGKQTEIGSLATGVQLQGTAINYAQGSLRQTGNPLDVAIQGQGFLQVQLDNGDTAYTRNGNLSIGPNGTLITSEGLEVQGQGGGAISIPADAGAITITQTGAVQVQTTGVAAPQEVGQLSVVQFENPDDLEKLGTSLYTLSPNSQQQPIEATLGQGTTLEQGFLEGSNTNVVSELIQSITGTRLYETLQKNIQIHNQTLGKLVSEVGSPK